MKRTSSSLGHKPASSVLTCITCGVTPGAVVAAAFLLLLGHRGDYLGHYAAGFGGTLIALSLGAAAMPDRQFRLGWPYVACLLTLLCIAGGAVTEATIYNLAKFDEVDFCNQSLGAVLAGLGVLLGTGDVKPSDWSLRSLCCAGLVFLFVGYYFAIFI